MPSKGKGLNRFSALSLSAPRSTTDGISTGSSSHDKGSNSTVGGLSVAPCTANDMEMYAPQHVPVDLSPPLAPSASCTVPTDTQTAFSWPSNHVPVDSSPPLAPFVPCTVPTNTQTAFSWPSDQSAGIPATPTSFTPPTAPSSFNGSNISSIKPSSSVSARIERSQKRKADGDGSSIISSSLAGSRVSNSSSARKRRAGNSEVIGRLEHRLEGIQAEFRETWKGEKSTVSEGSVATSPSAMARIPTHLLSRKAREQFLELDMALVSPDELAHFLDLLTDNVIFADTYLSLTKDPVRFAAGRKAWIELRLKEIQET